MQNALDPADLRKVQSDKIVWVRMNISRIWKGIGTCGHTCSYFSLHVCTLCIAQDENDTNALYQVESDDVYNVTVTLHSKDGKMTIPLTSSKPLHTLLSLFISCMSVCKCESEHIVLLLSYFHLCQFCAVVHMYVRIFKRVPTSSFHHSEEPVWVSGCCRLPGHGVLCCHVSGVRDPGSGVGCPAVLLVQGPHQTAGGGGAGERWGEGGAVLLVQGPHQTAGGGGAGERWGEGGAVLLVQGPHQTAGGGGVGERWGEGGAVLLLQGPHQTAGGGGVGERWGEGGAVLLVQGPHQTAGGGGVREGLCCSYKDLIRLQVGEG